MSNSSVSPVESLRMTLSRSEIRANLLRWIEDLETTDAKQGQRFLRTMDDGYCCLGRACVALNIELSITNASALFPGGVYDFADRKGAGGQEGANLGGYRHLVGLTRDEEDRCWKMNDKEGKTFREIAAWLREKVLPRYPAEAPLSDSVASSLDATTESTNG